MPSLQFLDAARHDLAEIALTIARESASDDAAWNFVDRIARHCEHLASLPGLLGRSRPEIRPEYRSVAFGNYVIFFRYVDATGPRSLFQIIHVVDGRRDLVAYFSRYPADG